MKKRLLIVAYSFPPLNSIASRRWSEMIPELKKDFDVYVFTQNSSGDLATYLDEEKIKRVGKIQNLLLTQTNYKRGILHSFISFFTKNLRSIDSTLFTWYFKNAKQFKIYVEEIEPDVILTTINPFATALFGRKAKQNNKKIKWVVDIRDSVSIYNENKKNFFSKFIDRSFDKYIVSKSDLIFTVSDTLSSILSKFYRKDVFTIYNGFYKLADKIAIDNKIIHLYYAGRIYNHREEAFFILINSIKNMNNIVFNIRLLSDDKQFNKYSEFLSSNNITNIFIKKAADSETIDKEEHASDILILLEDMNTDNDVGKGTLTGKLFEYLSIQKPILAVCREDSEIGFILEKTDSGAIHINKKGILKFIESYKIFNPNIEKIKFYSRSSQAKICKDHITEILGK